MKRRILFTAVGAAVVAVLLLALGDGARTPSVSADDSSVSWDIAMCVFPIDIGGDPVPDICPGFPGSTYLDAPPVGLNAGDNPEIYTQLWVDVTTCDNPGGVCPGIFSMVPEEPPLDLTVTFWSGIIPTPGLAIIDGDLVGEVTLASHSNGTILGVGFANIDPATGQPPPNVIAAAAPPRSGPDTLPLFDAQLLPPLAVGAEIVSHMDISGDGDPDTQDDVLTAACEPGFNFVLDGADCFPLGLAIMLNSFGLPPGTNIARSYGIVVLTGPVPPFEDVMLDLNVLVFDVAALPLPFDYLGINILGYPGLPAAAPTALTVTDQTVITNPPFSLAVRQYGVTGLGMVNRTVMAGTYNYQVLLSTAEDYDSDGLATYLDFCDTDPLNGVLDPDGDGLNGTCDDGIVLPPEVFDDGEGLAPLGPGNPGPFGFVPAAFSIGQDKDFDDWLNKADNCPNTPNGFFPDMQVDSDGDGVGDACEPGEIVGDGIGDEDGLCDSAEVCQSDVPGNGDGYAVPPPGMFHDHDNDCNDVFVIPMVGPGAEPTGEPGGPGKWCLAPNFPAPPASVATGLDPDLLLDDPPPPITLLRYSNPPMAVLTPGYNDSDDDGDPDFVDLAPGFPYDAADWNDDADLDGHSDACEVVAGTDALDAGSVPPPPALAGGLLLGYGGDCDGGGTDDYLEETVGLDPLFAGDDDPILDDVDTDGDGCSDQEETGPLPDLGGMRSPLVFWDWWGNVAPFLTVQDLDDVFAVLASFGAVIGDPVPSAPAYSYLVDRDSVTAPFAWSTRAPNGAVDLDDVFNNLYRFGDTCFPAP